MFRFSRFADKDLRLTDAGWKNEGRHESREVDIFGAVATANSPKEICEVKLTDYGRTLLIEDCDLNVGAAGRHEGLIVPNTGADARQYPWLLRTTLNDYAGLARFVRGLPADTSVVAPADLAQQIAG